MQKEVVDLLAPILTAFGFRQKRNVFWYETEDNVLLLEIQFSRVRNGESAKFTVNAGVFCKRIGADIGQESVIPPDWEDCHLRQRIGHLLPKATDIWWTIESDQPVMGDIDVADAVREFGVPYLKRFERAIDLQTEWRTGRSPGLTAFQRDQYLGLLEEE